LLNEEALVVVTSIEANVRIDRRMEELPQIMRKAEQELADRQAALESREQEVNRRAKQLESREQELHRRAEQLDKREADLAARNAALDSQSVTRLAAAEADSAAGAVALDSQTVASHVAAEASLFGGSSAQPAGQSHSFGAPSYEAAPNERDASVTRGAAASSLFEPATLKKGSLFQTAVPSGDRNGVAAGTVEVNDNAAARTAMAAALARQQEEEDDQRDEEDDQRDEEEQPAPTPAATPNASLFVLAASAPSSAASSTAPAAPKASLFGGEITSKASLFGGAPAMGSTVSAAPKPSLFGGTPATGSTTTAAPKASLFGGPPAAPSGSAATGNGSSSLFGGSKQTQVPSVNLADRRAAFVKKDSGDEALSARRKSWQPVTAQVDLPGATADAGEQRSTVKVNARTGDGGTAYRPTTVFKQPPPTRKSLQELLSADQAKT